MHERIREILSSFKAERAELIPLLQKVQEELGYLPEESISEIARYLGVSENEVFGLASFYAQFRFTRPGEHIIKACLGTACYVRGGERLLETIETELQVRQGETTGDGKFSLARVACLGCCALAPVVVIDEIIYGRMNVRKVKKVLDMYRKD